MRRVRTRQRVQSLNMVNVSFYDALGWLNAQMKILIPRSEI